MTNYADLQRIEKDLVNLIRPPRRMSPVDAAENYLYITTPGKRIEKWKSSRTPYLRKPLNLLASRKYKMIVFVGPAQCGKTLGLVQGAFVYNIMCRNMDMGIVHSSQKLAGDLSKREIKRLFKYSPELKEKLGENRRDNNTFDKFFRSGIIVSILWPTSGQLAGRAIPTMVFTDVDRMPADVSGEGSGLAQGRKRTQTFGSSAITLAESSPGCEWLDQRWEPSTPHEAPPSTSGGRENILEWYNQGTREWWYVPCKTCGEYYPQKPDINAFSWEESDDIQISAQSAGTICTHCGSIHGEDVKRWENANGVWVPDDCIIDHLGQIHGEPREVEIASFQLGGGAAEFQTRDNIVLRYLSAQQEHERTGEESALKTVVNTDIGGAYKRKSNSETRSGAQILKSRAIETAKKTVPANIRFLIRTIDVQKNRFVIQVHGYGIRKERAIIDRYDVAHSKRLDAEKKPKLVEPSSYLEDWYLLEPEIRKTYALSDNSGRQMPVLVTGCDSGGYAEKGTTGVVDKAYEFWRKLSNQGLAPKFALLRGDGNKSAARVTLRHPDTRKRSDRNSSARGDVPVWYLNTDLIKDTLANDLERTEPGPGYIHFPNWLADWFYSELTAEERDPIKGWIKTRRRNEAWDLLTYADALYLAVEEMNGAIHWDNPPSWAQTWDSNPYILDAEHNAIVQNTSQRKRLQIRGH